MSVMEKYKNKAVLVFATLITVCILVLHSYYKENYFITATMIKVDDKEIGYVENKEKAEKVIRNLIGEYSVKNGFKNIQHWKIKNKISYITEETEKKNVKEQEDIISKLKMKDEKTGLPVVLIELKGTIEEKEVITPATVITWSDELIKGQSKVKNAGSNGLKTVYKEVTAENNKILNAKKINEVVIEKPKDRIIINGSKNPTIVQTALLSLPSRGSFTSAFGWRNGKQHEGVDIGAPIGTPIYAASDGIISYANWMDGYGKFIRITHKNGMETMYGHCNSIDVKNGQEVKRGEKIGTVGNTGKSTGPHVHFEVRINGVAKNPMEYLK